MKKILGSKKGYTFVELLAVVAILAIIAAAGIITFVNVRKDLQLKAYDANAKELYLAAQNQMLQLKEYGQWDALLENHKVTNVYDDAFFGGKIGDDAPSDFGYWNPVRESEPVSITWGQFENDMRMIEVKASEPLPEFVEKILPLGSIEDGVRTNATYVIEYNIQTAEVYSVFYTESGDNLVGDNFHSAFYGDDLGDRNGRPTGEQDNSKSIRRNFKVNENEEYVIGYFGGGMLSEAVKYDELQIPDVILKNGEDLVLSIKDVNSNNDDRRTWSSVKITVTGMVSGESKTYYVIQPDSGNKYYLSDGTNNVFLVQTEEGTDGISYDIVLDSLTREIPTNVADEFQNAHFAHNFSELYPGEDIEVTVTISGNKDADDNIILAVPVARRVEGNSLFAGSVTEKGMGEGYVSSAEVQQLRHFENISEAISGVKLKADCTVDFTHSISFNDKGASVDDILPVVPKAYNPDDPGEPDKKITYLNDVPGAVEYPAGSFVPVDIGADKNITINGNGHNIYNLQISSPSGDVAGLGLFGTVSGNLTVKNLGIVSSDYVTGDSSCNVETLYTDADGKAAAIGAFVGEANGETTLNRCWSTVLINQTRTSGANVGGLVGISKNTLEINNCYVSGKTEGGKFLQEPAEANIYINVKDTTAGVVNEGGFVGKAESVVSITNSYVTASVGIDGLNNPGMYNVGGFIGYVDDDLSVDNSYFAGYLNLPLSYYVGDDATLNYSGFVGNKAAGATLSFDLSDSYWIEEFLTLTDIEMNSTLTNIEMNSTLTDIEMNSNDGGKSLANVLANVSQSDTTTAYPYDKELYRKHYDEELNGVNYPFENVAGVADATGVEGLKHHWGDWTTEAPDVKILIVSDIGIEKINRIDTANGESPPTIVNQWDSTDNGKSYYRYVPQGSGLKLNLEYLVKADYLTGFKGLAFTDLNEATIETQDGPFEADKRSTVIYASASALDAVELKFADDDKKNERSIDLEQIYNKANADIDLNIENVTEYYRSNNDSINVCYFFSVTASSDPKYVNLKKTIDDNFQNLASILWADVTDELKGHPDDNDYNSAYQYQVKEDEHYGKLYYKVKAFAYYADLDADESLEDYAEYIVDNAGVISLNVPEDVKLPRIVFSEIPEGTSAGKDELSFSVDLFRCKVSFGYTDSQIGGFYTVNGNTGDGKTCYVEYGSATLYDGPGVTTIDDDGNATGKKSIVITPVPGAATDPPIPVTDYPNIAAFIDWHNGSNVYYLYENGSLSLQSVASHTISNNDSVVWVIEQKTLDLTPKLEYYEVPKGIDPGDRAYFD